MRQNRRKKQVVGEFKLEEKLFLLTEYSTA